MSSQYPHRTDDSGETEDVDGALRVVGALEDDLATAS